MKKNLLAFLFGESQVDDEIAGIVETISDISVDGEDGLKVDKKPLTKALSGIGIDSGNLENDTRGLSLVFNNAEEYRAAHAILGEPDSLHALAHGGWVASPQGELSMANEPAEFRIRFLEIDTAQSYDSKASYSKSDTARLNKVKDIIKKGREFATTAPDFDDENNPVDHSAPKSGKRDKGVGKAADGSDPEGKPKGSEGNPSTGKSGSSPSKGDLTQPAEGEIPDSVREAAKKWVRDYKKSVEEAGYAARGDGTGIYADSHGEHDVDSAHVNLGEPTSTAPAVSGQIDDLGGEPEVLCAPGCTCPTCEGDPIGISGAASRQARGIRGGVPGGPAAGYWGEADYQPKTGEKCHCKPGVHRDNCPDCEGTGKKIDFKKIRQASKDKAAGIQSFAEGAHKAGCQCGFCKNKGNIASLRKGKSKSKGADKPEETGKEPTEESAEDIVNALIEGNPGTPSGILGTKSFSTLKVPGGAKDRKFKPAKGMVQSSPENSVVTKQTKPNKSA